MLYEELSVKIKEWGQALGFQQIGITDTDLTQYEKKFQIWIGKKFHGEMSYMSAHGSKRLRPQELIPNTLRVISARIDYLPADTEIIKILNNPHKAYLSRYALGCDYHRLIRKRLKQLATQITAEIGPFGYRAFADSAPVLEKPLAEKAGLGWIGKNTNLINRSAGSWFFLGEIFTDLPLPIDQPTTNHCGSCTACMDVCPTKAIIGPYQLDARLCISYLTIELRGAIPVELRPLIGNRIYGCDDCQICCPWNKFAKFTAETAFHPRQQLQNSDLLSLFAWTEAEFLEKTAGSAIRRIGYEAWQRNIAVALGNLPPGNTAVLKILTEKLDNNASTLVKEHILWAIERQKRRGPDEKFPCG